MMKNNVIREKERDFMESKFYLMHTDGYDITTEDYPTFKAAQDAMKEAYEAVQVEGNGEEWEDMSYCDDDYAIYYARGENVYVWRILTVK
jgi:hypothetical protein